MKSARGYVQDFNYLNHPEQFFFLFLPPQGKFTKSTGAYPPLCLYAVLKTLLSKSLKPPLPTTLNIVLTGHNELELGECLVHKNSLCNRLPDKGSIIQRASCLIR